MWTQVMTAVVPGRRWSRRAAYIGSYPFPAALRAKLADELPGLTSAQYDLCLEGLRSWFSACLLNTGYGSLGMPSRAVDVAWHEFILMSRPYTDFCRQAFGKYLHHEPESLLSTPMDLALVRTLRLTGADGKGVPLLFRIDEELGIAGGRKYDDEAVAAMLAMSEPRQVVVSGRPRARIRRGRRYNAGQGIWIGDGDASGGGSGCGGGGGCGGGCGGGG